MENFSSAPVGNKRIHRKLPEWIKRNENFKKFHGFPISGVSKSKINIFKRQISPSVGILLKFEPICSLEAIEPCPRRSITSIAFYSDLL